MKRRRLLLVAAIAALFVIFALGAAIMAPEAWPALLMAVLLAVGCVFERQRYRAAQARPLGDGWTPTDERFIDDVSGRPVTVWFNAATGERHYAEDKRH